MHRLGSMTSCIGSCSSRNFLDEQRANLKEEEAIDEALKDVSLEEEQNKVRKTTDY